MGLVPNAIIFFLLTSYISEVFSDGFCGGGNDFSVDTENGYKKVQSPTLEPRHLEDLPGFTRSVVERDHALISIESRVYGPLPNWKNSLVAFLITPAMGAHFTFYFVKMGEKSSSAPPSKDTERLIFVLEGDVNLGNVSNFSGISEILEADSFAYFPPNFELNFSSENGASLIVVERQRKFPTSGEFPHPEFQVGSTSDLPLIPVDGEVFALRKLLPTGPAYDFNIHIMDFQPGEYLNVKEVHYNQHGLVLLEGRGIYRLGNSWYPVQAGDVIWMAPFVPQWYAALGKSRSRYFLYKDVNTDPLFG